MDFKELTEQFFHMEDELDLFELKIQGVYFWERIRFSVHRQILVSSGIIGEAHTKTERTFANRLKSGIRSVKNLAVKNPYFFSEKDILFLGSPRRMLKDDGKWWDIYCDPIIEVFDMPYAYIELPYQNMHFTPAKTREIGYMDIINYLGAIKCKFNSFELSEEELVFLENIQYHILNRFKVKINLKNQVHWQLNFRKNVLPLYERLLRKVKPKLVILVCSYGFETFIEACKSMDIPVAELQHGVLSRYHLGYSFPGPKKTKRAFPDYFLAFGDYWKDSVEFPLEKERIISVGYPYLENEVKKYSDIKKKDQILFISQGTIGGEMSKFAVELSKDHRMKHKIIYKLHPGEYSRWRKAYPWLGESGIWVIDYNEIPLYRLFAESKIQVGVHSTAIFEGLNFGLRTYLLDLPGVEYMEGLIESQDARIVKSIDEFIVSLFGENFGKRINTEKYFRCSSIENIKSAITSILLNNKGETDE